MTPDAFYYVFGLLVSLGIGSGLGFMIKLSNRVEKNGDLVERLLKMDEERGLNSQRVQHLIADNTLAMREIRTHMEDSHKILSKATETISDNTLMLRNVIDHLRWTYQDQHQGRPMPPVPPAEKEGRS